VTIISLYLNPIPDPSAPPIEHSIFQVMKEASLLFCLPDNPYFLPKSIGSHAVQEATYACQFFYLSGVFLFMTSSSKSVFHRLRVDLCAAFL
jgi:hypothetical protein